MMPMTTARRLASILILLPSIALAAASCLVGLDSDEDDDDVSAAQQGAKADGGADASADAKADASPDASPWPTDPNALWERCGVEPPPASTHVSLAYGSPPFGMCGVATVTANGTRWCDTSIVLNRNNPDCEPCDTLRHETCHAQQHQRVCDECRASGVPAASFPACVTGSTSACRSEMEAQCYSESCRRGVESSCAMQGLYCDNAPSPSGPIACDRFSAGRSTCACGSMSANQCSHGACPSGQVCQSSGGGCGCVTPPPPPPPPPPTDAGSDAPKDAPADG